jgi:general secretion pathway protein A
MYLNFFGLQDKPFSIAPDPKFLFMTDQHREALAHLLFGVGDEGGFVLLTGEIGTGKTTVCRRLLSQLDENVNVAFIVNPRLSACELLQSICDEFEIDYGDNLSIKFLVDLINQFLLNSHSNGKNTILIIDEAQNLSDEVLEQLRLLTNLETNEKKLLQLILLGQPELNTKLEQYNLRQLAQRVTARFHLKSLSENQMISYIKHRLHVAGFRGDIFEDSAFKYIFNQSRGIPRLVNVICDRALLGAYTQDKIIITQKIVKNACKEVLGNLKNTQSKLSLFTNKLYILIVLASLITASFFFYGDFLSTFLYNLFNSSSLNVIA